MEEKVKVLVGGPNGYGGQETIEILEGHPHVSEIVPLGRDLPVEEDVEEADVAILALPRGVSGRYAARLGQLGMRVIDLSGDLRLKTTEDYKKWYEIEHPAPELLSEEAEDIPYVLPELSREGWTDSKLIAMPGCYAQSVLLPVVPLVRAGLLEPGATIKINAVSGVSGMGKEGREEADRIMTSGATRTYKAGHIHQHVPEIEQQLDGRKIFFAPAVGPYFRGIKTIIDMRLTRTAYDRHAQEVLEETYHDEPQVTVRPLGSELPTHIDTAGTDSCHIGLVADNRELQVVSSLDNIGRGGPGAGVLAMNMVFGFPKTAGLRIT